MSRPIGLIAGAGRLPIYTALGVRAAGLPVVCVGYTGMFDPELPGLCDRFDAAALTRPSKWIRLLRKWGASEAVMVGKVQKTRMYDPLRAFRSLPDWRAAKLWYFTLRHDKRSDRVLAAVTEMLGQGGITLIDSTKYIPECLAHSGVLTRIKPTEAQNGDIEFALPIVKRMGELDIGQSIAVKEREVIAVEAIEGTDAMIRRAGELCKSGKWTLVKVAKPKQDMRFDVPTVGPGTIESLRAAGAACLAVEAGKVILLDKDDLLKAADRAGIAVVGVKI